MLEEQARVWVVQEDEATRSALVEALREQGYEVQAHADGFVMDQVVAQFGPDLVILDAYLSNGPGGYALARSLRAKSDTPLLFLTAAGSLKERLAGFHVGADDYVVKPFSTEELSARIRALLRRAGRLAPTLRSGDLVIDEASRKVTRGGTLLELTPTEYDLLTVLAQHPGQVLSKMQLLTQVWGFDAYDINVVEVHMSALRRKLEAHGPRVVHTVRASGYVLRT